MLLKFSYPALSAVMEDLDTHQRVLLALQFPQVRALERRLPYRQVHVNAQALGICTLRFGSFSLKSYKERRISRQDGEGEEKRVRRTKIKIRCERRPTLRLLTTLSPEEVFLTIFDFFFNRKGTQFDWLMLQEGVSIPSLKDSLTPSVVQHIDQLVFSEYFNFEDGLALPAKHVYGLIREFKVELFQYMFKLFDKTRRSFESMVEISLVADDESYILEKEVFLTEVAQALNDIGTPSQRITLPEGQLRGFPQLRDMEVLYVKMRHGILLINYANDHNIFYLRVFVERVGFVNVEP